MSLPEVFDDVGEDVVLFLHFLVVTPALFGLPSAYEQLHGLEYLVHSPHMSVHEVLIVYLQEKMIFLILLVSPVPLVHIPVGTLFSVFPFSLLALRVDFTLYVFLFETVGEVLKIILLMEGEGREVLVFWVKDVVEFVYEVVVDVADILLLLYEVIA